MNKDSIIMNYNAIPDDIKSKKKISERYRLIEERIEHILAELPTWIPSPGMDESHVHTPERFF